jgi:hypothetical protein
MGGILIRAAAACEAVNAGSVDIGATGDTPPIFAQAAGAAIVYVAGQPTTNGQGILVRAEFTYCRYATIASRVTADMRFDWIRPAKRGTRIKRQAQRTTGLIEQSLLCP